MTDDDLKRELMALGHAIQTGVMWDQQLDRDRGRTNDHLHKHTRTGVDTLFAQQEGLARLLIAKGVMTEREYLEAMVAGMRRERDRYQASISARLGRDVTLA